VPRLCLRLNHARSRVADRDRSFRTRGAFKQVSHGLLSSTTATGRLRALNRYSLELPGLAARGGPTRFRRPRGAVIRNRPLLGVSDSGAPADLLTDVPMSPADALNSSTFDVNRLQQFPLHKHGHILGTLNPSIPIPASKHLATIPFAQAIPSQRLYTAQKRLHELDDDLFAQGVSAVGAWRGAGFHEDGWVAGIRAAEKLGGKMPFPSVPRDREVARMGVVEWLRGFWVGPVREGAMESKEKLL
jgi:hypothetical protein